MQKLQNKALRIICLSSRYTTGASLHKRLNILPLFIRRQQNLMKIVHSYIGHNQELTVVPQLLNNDSRVTRQNTAPFIPLKTPSHFKVCTFMCSQRSLTPLVIRKERDKELFKMLIKHRAFAELNTLSVFG